MFAVGLINQAIVAAGGPANLVTAVETPTIETAGELFNHPDIRLLLVTGGPGVAKAAMGSPKRPSSPVRAIRPWSSMKQPIWPRPRATSSTWGIRQQHSLHR